MSYQQQIDIIVNNLNKINQLENELKAAESASEKLRSSLEAIGESISVGTQRARQLREAARGLSQATKAAQIPRDERGRFVGGAARRQFNREVKERRERRLAIAAEGRAQLTVLRELKNRNKIESQALLQQNQIKQSRKAEIEYVKENLSLNKALFRLDLKRQEVLNRYAGRLEEFNRKGRGKGLSLDLRAESRSIQKAFQVASGLSGTTPREIVQNIRLIDSLSQALEQLNRRQNELRRTTIGKSVVIGKAGELRDRIAELRRTEVIKPGLASALTTQTRKAIGVATSSRGDIESARDILRGAEIQIKKAERRARTAERINREERKITGELVSQRQELTTINALEERISRLREAGIPEARLTAPTQMVGGLRSAIEARNLREYRVGVVDARDALTELENAEARRNRTLTQSEKLSRARNQLSKQRDSSMLREIKDLRSLDVLERRISGLGEDPVAAGLRQQVGAARQALEAGDMGQFARDLEISKNAIKDAEDAQETYNRTLKRNEKAIKAGNEYARLLEQEIVAAEKLGQINAGVFDDSDLRNFLAGLQETEDSYKKLLNVGKSWDRDYRQRQALVKEGLTQERNFNKAQSGIIADVRKFGQQLTQLGGAGVIKPKTLERWRDTLRSAGGDARNLRRPFEDIRADLDKIIPGINAVASRVKNVKKTTGGAKAGGILRTGEFSPVGGNVRLENVLGSAKILEQRLLNLQAGGIDVAGVLTDLQKEVNRAKQADYDISIKNLGILDQTLNKTRQFIQLENAVAAGKPRIAGATKTGQFPFSPVRGTEAIAGSPKFVKAQNKLIDGVRNAGAKLVNLVESGLIPADVANRLRDELVGIGSAARQASEPFTVLTESLRKLSGGINALSRDQLSGFSRAIADFRVGTREDAKFLGNRTMEQAIQEAVKAFAEPTRLATRKAIGPTAPAMSEMDAMLADFKEKFANLTNNPRFYGKLLSQIPSEKLTIDMASAASARAAATRVGPSALGRSGQLESEILASYQDAVGKLPAGVTQLFDRIRSVFDAMVGRSFTMAGDGAGGGGGGGGGRGGGPFDPGDFDERFQRASQKGIDGLLSLAEVRNPSKASINSIERLVAVFNELRGTINVVDEKSKQYEKALREASASLSRQLERRDVGADFLTRQFTSRGAAAISEGLIGGAFPLLFGQGVGASILGGAGGAAGGFLGGGLGFGLSLLGTFAGSAFDTLIASTIETGSALKDLVGNFDAIKQASLISSSANEKVIQSLIDSGRVATAYDLIQADLNRTIGSAGIQSLQNASTASDRLNRAMAALGKQLEVFVAGPLAGFLNAIAGIVERVNLENRAGRVFEGLSPERAKAFQRDLREAAPKQVIPFFGDAGKFGASSGGDVRAAIPSNVFNQILAKYEAQLPQPKQTDQQKAEATVRAAQQALAIQQEAVDIQAKQNEARDAINAFRQEALSVTREQQDLDRQGLDLRRQYEEQIGDIRRSIAERVTQIEQENRQRELDIVIKQGEIRQAQLRNAGLTMQRELAGDELASGLADAVQTYLESQLSAQNQIEQRRKQFEVEMVNQQIEADKFKIDTNRAISKLNTDTARQVEQINIGIARRNEDMRMKNFETERDMARIRLVTMRREAELTKAQLIQRRGEAELAIEKNPADAAAQSRLTAISESIVDLEASLAAIEKARSAIKSIAAPAQLTGLQPVKALGVSFAGVDKAAGKAKQLQGTLKNMLDTLDQLAAGGDKLTFLTTLDNLVFGEAVQRQNDLNQAMSEASALLYGAASGADIISRSYANLSAKIQANTAYTDVEKQKMLALLKVYEPAQLSLQELAYTQEYYTKTLQNNSNSIQEVRDSINGLLSPISEYKKQLAIIQSSGGVAVLGDQAQKLLETATEIDRLNEKLSILNGLNEIAGAWTDSFMSFNKELLKTGNLMDSLSNFVEDIAGKSIDMLVEFALKPMQERMFKSMADFLGFEPEANPLLKPIESIDKTLGDVKGLSEQMLGVIRARQKAADAVAQGVGTASAQNDLIGQSATAMVPEIKRLIAAGADPGLPSGERFAASMSDADIVSMLRRAVVQMPSANGGLGFDIETRQGFSVPSNLLEQQATLSSIAGSIAQRYGVPMSFLAGSSSTTPLQRLSATGRPNVTPAPTPVGRSGGRDVFALPGDTPLPTSTATTSTPAAEAANNIRAMSAASADAAAIAAQRNAAEQESIAKIKQFGQSLGTGIQVLGGIAMAVGGVQAIRKGGAYNTLMGLSGIFGGISSIAGSFSKIGGSVKGFANGGRPPLYQPSWIGENGPELWMPDQAGTVIPVDDLFVPGLDGPGAAPDMAAPYVRSGGRMAPGEAPDDPSGGIPYTRSGYGSTIPYQRTDSTREIERIDRAISSPGELPPIKYETQRVNEYDFVTPDQLERSNQRTAQVARKMTLQEIADSLRTRNRLGIP